MRYLLLALLLVGCADQQVKSGEQDAEKLAKEEAARKRCDYMVSGPKDSDVYLKCLEYE